MSDPGSQKRVIELVTTIIRQAHELHGLLNLEFSTEQWLDPRSQEISIIQHEVCRYYGVTHARLIGKGRHAREAHARQAAMALCRQVTSATLDHISASFHRHHTTVLYAMETIEKHSSVDEKFKTEFEQIKKAVGERLAEFSRGKKQPMVTHNGSLAG